jgi:hypothetical protein
MGRSSSLGRGKILLLPASSRPVLGPKSISGTISPGVKRPGREADHSLPTSAMELYIHIRFHAVVRNYSRTPVYRGIAVVPVYALAIFPIRGHSVGCYLLVLCEKCVCLASGILLRV